MSNMSIPHDNHTHVESYISFMVYRYSPDGMFLASGGEDNKLVIWTVGQEQYEPTNSGGRDSTDTSQCVTWKT